MPYIKQGRRDDLLNPVGTLDQPQNAGELNYCLTWRMLWTPILSLDNALEREIDEYLSVRDESYSVYNEVVGALECCRREFLRRRRRDDVLWSANDLVRHEALAAALNRLYEGKIAPYEDTKIEQNGDVY